MIKTGSCSLKKGFPPRFIFNLLVNHTIVPFFLFYNLWYTFHLSFIYTNPESFLFQSGFFSIYFLIHLLFETFSLSNTRFFFTFKYVDNGRPVVLLQSAKYMFWRRGTTYPLKSKIAFLLNPISTVLGHSKPKNACAKSSSFNTFLFECFLDLVLHLEIFLSALASKRTFSVLNYF